MNYINILIRFANTPTARHSAADCSSEIKVDVHIIRYSALYQHFSCRTSTINQSDTLNFVQLLVFTNTFYFHFNSRGSDPWEWPNAFPLARQSPGDGADFHVIEIFIYNGEYIFLKIKSGIKIGKLIRENSYFMLPWYYLSARILLAITLLRHQINPSTAITRWIRKDIIIFYRKIGFLKLIG